MGKGQGLYGRIQAGLMIIMTAAILCGCATSVEKGGDVWSRTGWIDDNTYRVRADGTSKLVPKGTNTEAVKEDARKNAVMNARIKIINEFGSGKIESSNIAASLMDEFIKEIGPALKEGKVIAERFTPDYKCEIIFEIRHEGLRKRYESF